MFIFGLHSTSDDQLSNLSDKSHPKCETVAAKSSKNEIFIFGLCATSDDQQSDMSDKSCLKCEKMATKLSKNEMLNFGLHSTSDDRLSDLSDQSPKMQKKWPPNRQKLKCLFLDYVQLLMIG